MNRVGVGLGKVEKQINAAVLVLGPDQRSSEVAGVNAASSSIASNNIPSYSTITEHEIQATNVVVVDC